MKIYSSDADQNFLLFHGFGGVSFLSGDCGSTIQAFEHNEEFFEFKLNPTDTNYILASSKLNCSDLSPDYCPLAVDLHYSDKRGLNWRKIQTSVIEFAWLNNFD